MSSKYSQQLTPCNNRRQPSIVVFHTVLLTLLSLHKIFLTQWYVKKPDHSLVKYNSGRKMKKCVNNRFDLNYIEKFSNSYIFSSVVNYESATGFKVSGKCNKL